MSRRILVSIFSVAVFAFVASSVAPVRAHQTGVAGIWKLNEAESNNPNGLPLSQGGPAKPKGLGTEKDMTGGASKSFWPIIVSDDTDRRKALILFQLPKRGQDVVLNFARTDPAQRLIEVN